MKGPALKQEKNREDERTMISKTCCIARIIVLASFAPGRLLVQTPL